MATQQAKECTHEFSTERPSPNENSPQITCSHELGSDVQWARFFKEGAPVAVTAFLFYLITTSPYIGFGDTAIMVNAIEQRIIVSHVNNHPLTVAVGWLFSQFHNGEPATSANFVSVFFGSLTVLIWFVGVRIAGTTRSVATLASLPLIVMHSLWWHSTVIENYAASAALTMATYASLAYFDRAKKRGGLYAAAFFAGLSILNHVENSMLCLGVALTGMLVAAKAVDGVGVFLRCGIAALLGLLPWIGIVIRDILVGPGAMITLRDAFVGKFEGTFFGASAFSMVWDTAYIFWHQSPLLLLPVTGVVGFIAYRRRYKGAMGALGMALHFTLITVVFSGYPTWDRFAFLLPAIMGLGFMSGLGLEEIRNALGASRGLRFIATWCLLTTLVAPTIYLSVTFLAHDPSSIWAARYGNQHSANLYDQSTFIESPNKSTYAELEIFASLLDAKLPRGSLFLDDDSRTYYTLADYYQRYRGLRPDVKFLLVNSWGFSDWGLESNQVAKLMEDAYRTGKPFFVPSIGHPYGTFFEEARKRFSVSFSVFPLSASRWIYKLDTLPESLSEVRRLAAESIASQTLLPVRMSTNSGSVNLSPKHIRHSSADGVKNQAMATFGPNWERGDQIFVASASPGASIELFVVPEGDKSSYTLSVAFTTAPDFGEVEVLLNDFVVTSRDLYSPVVDRTVVALPKSTYSREGDILSIRVVGKNVSSGGYNIGVDSVHFK